MFHLFKVNFVFKFFLYKKKIDYIFVYATSPLLQSLIGVFLKNQKSKISNLGSRFMARKS